MPERTGSALLHWLNGPEVRPLHYALSITTPHDLEAFVALHQAAQGKAVGAVALAGQVALQPLPPALAQKETQTRQTEQFRTAYAPFGAVFRSVQIADLIAPQVWADTAYADELAAQASAHGDEEALFDYCFAYGRLEPPMMIGMNAAVIVSGRRSLGTLSALRLQSAGSEKATFEFDALPRPNWLLVYAVAQTGQLVVGNGVHHVLGLIRAGRDHAYCLVMQRPLDQMFNYQDVGIFKSDRLTEARPPLVRDYLDLAIADVVGVRAVDQFMRFGVSQPPDIGQIPQSEAVV